VLSDCGLQPKNPKDNLVFYFSSSQGLTGFCSTVYSWDRLTPPSPFYSTSMYTVTVVV